MKVYVKKGENVGTIVPYIVSMIIISIIIVIFSLSIPSLLGYFDFPIEFSDYGSFIDFITEYGFSILCFIAFAFVFLFIYFCIIFLFVKPPKNFKAKLISKKSDIYDGKEITYMNFLIQNKNNMATSTPLKYRCFTYNDNDLVEGNYYLIKVKEFNWKIKEVDVLEQNFDNKLNGFSLFIPFLLILFVFGGGLIMASLRMDYCIRNGLQFLDNLPALVIFSIFVVTDLYVYFGSKDSEDD